MTILALFIYLYAGVTVACLHHAFCQIIDAVNLAAPPERRMASVRQQDWVWMGPLMMIIWPLVLIVVLLKKDKS
jgi:H+/Cl- antiporter ClcA